MQHIDWAKVFMPDTPILEIIVRGTVTYLALFTLLRIILRRESSNLGITDMLVIVLIADASQNAMAGAYNSIADGVILVAVIIGWSYTLNWLSFNWPFFERLLSPRKLLLVDNGKMIKRNMRKELITDEELMTEVRKAGLTELQQIKVAFMESDGSISIVKNEKE
ncbi:DUF421 domain-containing protein [Segetibacter aerophilus]|uniref:DUF421 domain-containing protein n=1 Tax=Segetibacter aerophilus TaxID=670293 RepID=A0A512BHP1_9BACT|nr:YetF domain-containing protein [Segetibacter aerophilus]GEO11482.1 DUF421 domain-containing protein [Segetibacter aerophilus]